METLITLEIAAAAAWLTWCSRDIAAGVRDLYRSLRDEPAIESMVAITDAGLETGQGRPARRTRQARQSIRGAHPVTAA